MQRKSVSAGGERKGERKGDYGATEEGGSDQANGNNQYLATNETTFSQAVSFNTK